MIGVFFVVFSTENIFKYITTRLGVAQKKKIRNKPVTQLRHSHLPVLISVITCSPIYRSSWAHAQLRSGTWQQVGEPVHDGWGHRQGSYVLVYLLQLGDYGAGDQLHHMMRKMESHSCPLSEETWKWKQSPHSNRYSSQNWNRGNVHSSLGNTLAGHGGNLICGAVIIVRKKKKKIHVDCLDNFSFYSNTTYGVAMTVIMTITKNGHFMSYRVSNHHIYTLHINDTDIC